MFHKQVLKDRIFDLIRSDAGASPDEAVSWGKIKREAKPVKVKCSIIFLLYKMFDLT
jgi:deoxyhypusine synthase